MLDVVIVGGGPSGIIAALESSRRNLKVCLVDQNDDIGKKLAITGGGRCNVSSDVKIEDFGEYIKRNYKFLYSAFRQFSNEDLFEYLRALNCSLKKEDSKVFLKDDNGARFVKILKEELVSKGVIFSLNTRVLDIVFEDGLVKCLKTSKGDLRAKDYLIASGGLSYSNLGSDGSILNMLESKKIVSIISPKPCLVSINFRDNIFAKLAGVSIRCRLTTSTYSLEGEVLFTHKGISGPTALNFSGFLVDKSPDLWNLYLDFMPNFGAEEVYQLFTSIKGKGKMTGILKTYLPQSLIRLLFPSEVYDFSNLSKKELEALVRTIKKNYVEIEGFEGYNKAIITRGGVEVKEINPKTMRCKNIENLYFAGEVIDVDGFTGGYNLQIAFSTGYVAGKNIGGI